MNAASGCEDVHTPVFFAGEEGQQGTLAKSLLTSSLLCQGTAIISQDAIQEPSLARFVATVVHFRKTYASLLQPAHFTSSRELRWHGATTGQIPASVRILVMWPWACLLLSACHAPGWSLLDSPHIWKVLLRNCGTMHSGQDGL